MNFSEEDMLMLAIAVVAVIVILKVNNKSKYKRDMRRRDVNQRGDIRRYRKRDMRYMRELQDQDKEQDKDQEDFTPQEIQNMYTSCDQSKIESYDFIIRQYMYPGLYSVTDTNMLIVGPIKSTGEKSPQVDLNIK